MRKHETAVCGTACTVVWEVGKCESRRQMPFMISIYLLPDWLNENPVPLRRQREERTKRRRDEETKRRRDEEIKRKRGKDQENPLKSMAAAPLL